MHRSRTSIAGLTAFALVAPASAGAATLTPDRPCYVTGQTMAIGGAGWVAGSGFSVEGDQIFASGLADAMGAFSVVDETAPAIAADRIKPAAYTLTGKQDGTEVATTSIRVVNFIVKPRDPNGRPTGTTRWSFAGFEPGKTIYLHIRRGSRTYTTRVGEGDRACGTARKRIKRLPGVPASKIRDGKYRLYADTRKAFSKGGYQYGPAVITIS